MTPATTTRLGEFSLPCQRCGTRAAVQRRIENSRGAWVFAAATNRTASEVRLCSGCIATVESIAITVAKAKRRRTRPVPAPAPVCTVCEDTHVMTLRDAEVPCTHCPTPCQECRAGGNGPYCTATPCSCACHTRAVR